MSDLTEQKNVSNKKEKVKEKRQLLKCAIATYIKCNDNTTTYTCMCVCVCDIYRAKQENENKERETKNRDTKKNIRVL
jgi:hypothetical protein